MIRYFALLLFITLGLTDARENIPKVHTVEIKGMKFIPATLEVKKGDQVQWVNNDLVIHNVTKQDGAWASPAIAVKKTWKKTIESDTKYYCSLHPVMKGTVIVK